MFVAISYVGSVLWSMSRTAGGAAILSALVFYSAGNLRASMGQLSDNTTTVEQVASKIDRLTDAVSRCKLK